MLLFTHLCGLRVGEVAALRHKVLRMRPRPFGGSMPSSTMLALPIFLPVEDTSCSTWRRIMETNLAGAFLVSQATIPALKETKGAIVNIGSISVLRASTMRVAYHTPKDADIHMTKQQTAELGEYGIRANCVFPGPFKTKLAIAVHSPEIISAYLDAMPLGRYGTENGITEVIHFLCPDKASFVTGQIVAADGGFETTGVGLPALRANKQGTSQALPSRDHDVCRNPVAILLPDLQLATQRSTGTVNHLQCEGGLQV